MTTRQEVLLQGGVRSSLQRTPAQRLAQRWVTRGVRHVGPGAFVDRRAEFLRHPERISLGGDTIVKAGARLCATNATAEIVVGDGTSIGYHTHVFASLRIEIGADCLIAPFCYLVDANHGTAPGQRIREQQMRAAPIVLGEDVWLGTGVTVLPGVTIGTGSVVAAGSVVSKDLPDYSIAAGTPARVVGDRAGDR